MNADQAALAGRRVLAWGHAAIAWLSGSQGGTQQLIQGILK